jgi:hypothetical protein
MFNLDEKLKFLASNKSKNIKLRMMRFSVSEPVLLTIEYSGRKPLRGVCQEVMGCALPFLSSIEEHAYLSQCMEVFILNSMIKNFPLKEILSMPEPWGKSAIITDSLGGEFILPNYMYPVIYSLCGKSQSQSVNEFRMKQFIESLINRFQSEHSKLKNKNMSPMQKLSQHELSKLIMMHSLVSYKKISEM